MDSDDSDSEDGSNSSPDEDDLSGDVLYALKTSMIQSKFDTAGHYFLPDGILARLTTKTSIRNILGIEKPTEEDIILVDFVETRAKKVFAICAFIDLRPLHKAMTLFRRNNFSDQNLPIKPWSSKKFKSASSNGIQHDFVAMEGPVDAKTQDVLWAGRWAKIYDFQEAQWKFLAPIFRIDKDHPSQDVGKHILPFISKQTISREGAFGDVYQCEIHKDHIKSLLHPDEKIETMVAVKQIKVDNETDPKNVVTHWEKEVGALARMNELNHEHIVRFITAFRRGSAKDPEHHLIFEWANGGNLLNLWKATPQPVLEAPLIEAVVKQLLGLADALSAAHYLEEDGKLTGGGYRHGDLKPANILWFRDSNGIGRLKIGDWGEAKIHNVVTALRHSKTTAKFATRRYEAPEVETGVKAVLLGQAEFRRSRLYDIWAMGCVTLEFIVWLLYGYDVLDRFNKSVKNESNGESPFYQLSNAKGKKVAKVHSVVEYWIDHMARDPSCKAGATALGDLLQIVRTGLLVVKLPKEGGTFNDDNPQQPDVQRLLTQLNQESTTNQLSASQPQETGDFDSTLTATVPTFEFDLDSDDKPGSDLREPQRLRATKFFDMLENIMYTDEIEGYWQAVESDRQPPTDLELSLIALTTTDTKNTESLQEGLAVPVPSLINYGDDPNLDPNIWEFEVDNEFVSSLLPASNGLNRSSSETRISSNLCNKCEEFRDRVWNPGFNITYQVQDLLSSAIKQECDLCCLLWRTCKRNQGTSVSTAQFQRIGSVLMMNGGHIPVLSLFRSPEYRVPAVNSIQIGFATLPDVGSSIHFEVIRRWLDDCDEKHQGSTCMPARQEYPHTPKEIPTRLIDVGDTSNDMVRLWETGKQDTVKWIALSHQWGENPPHYSTTRHNLADHILGTKLEDLPATFKDAVRVTRALGHRYLWIDSLCIIQGDDGDFLQEAKRMEIYYSGAYCVIAASCASGHYAGFLHARIERDHVSLVRETDSQAPFHICETIDNFKSDVLEGALNRRGWVLQEHALARRTIFFTENQTYWECGNGVRCETLTKMNNKSAKLLGDPNFPEILFSAPQRERIERYQELYRVYSRLGLSRAYDRPAAIGGLQQRLLRTMAVKGGYGILYEDTIQGTLARSLLWHRGGDTSSLTRIKFTGVSVPSWSWMAYTGGIDYLSLDFGRIDWEKIESPWSRSDKSDGTDTLTAVAQRYNEDTASERQSTFIFDLPEYAEQYETICVVLGVQKGSMPLSDKRHYVLLVVPTNGSGRSRTSSFERVGVGYLPGRCIATESTSVNIH
ncbi:HET-domain-containing protein [Dothidotthia symphoricarpi CBS 119687]|uniref:HET-domain-containing protein n=1 Tax=Dothidotthia symphoricarpi CBS 119687 TaxID=1392245 RepID=A0A6A6ALQ4_9PLEO|nr:HET-domain-containing protein [Dothidotthia symphoricarpi CBS 119687]KAF2132922.1 HET-domain-containing protein [Dothidotthia symphoricarpi CBS 119687]